MRFDAGIGTFAPQMAPAILEVNIFSFHIFFFLGGSPQNPHGPSRIGEVDPDSFHRKGNRFHYLIHRLEVLALRIGTELDLTTNSWSQNLQTMEWIIIRTDGFLRAYGIQADRILPNLFPTPHQSRAPKRKACLTIPLEKPDSIAKLF